MLRRLINSMFMFLLAVGLSLIGLTGHACLSAQLFPDDPRFHQQWHLNRTDTEYAWLITTGSTQITVAVNDSGVDYTHPDLFLNIWMNQREIPKSVSRRLTDVDDDGLITFWDLNDASGVNCGPNKITDLNSNGFIDGGDLLFPVAVGGWADGKDNGNNGFVDDLIGWDFIDNDNDPMEHQLDASTDGHGTFIAGIIGAVGNNGIGIAGVNWKIQIIPICRIAEIPEAIDYAVDNGARISNHSYGAPASNISQEVIDAVYAAIEFAESKDHLLVAGAGNDGVDSDIIPWLPAALDLPNIISVCGTNRDDKLTSFSGFGGNSIDLGAPARGIWSTSPLGIPGEDYHRSWGVSYANPQVVGAAALILSINPNLSYAEVKSLILENADPVPDLQNKTETGRRLNVFKALLATPLPD